MSHSTKFLQVYLYLALAFGLLGLLDSIFTVSNFMPPLYVMSILAVSVLFFIFNIITIPLFMHQRVPRLAFVLPIYHVVSFMLFLGLGVALFVFNMAGKPMWVWAMISVGIMASLFEIIFSLYLLRKLGFRKAVLLPSGQMRH